MKLTARLLSLAALFAAAPLAALFMPGCGNDVTPGETGGSGGDNTSSTTTGSSTSTVMSNPQCDSLCFHLQEIDCNVLQNCTEDCVNHLNAPTECVDEADALIACWVEHLDEFTCTQMQVLPPASCKTAEEAFNKCVNGGMIDASCICSSGVGVGDGINNCSRKTSCDLLEYTQTCQKLADGEPWTCSCFANGGLLGTCSEAPEFEHCSNMYGCCVPLFCAAANE